jgi:hypothetical protein
MVRLTGEVVLVSSAEVGITVTSDKGLSIV